MSPGAHFLSSRPSDVHSSRPWAPFSYVNTRLDGLVRDLMAAAGVEAGSRLLDYGCAQQPYRGFVPPGAEYVGADLIGNPQADVVLGDDGRVPLPDGSVDAVLSTQVLEHVTDPSVYLTECHRLLRPGGSLLLSTHGIMYYHRDPEDYWRWTSPGLAALVESHGFEVRGSFGVLGLAAASLQLFQDATVGRVPRILRAPYLFLLQAAVRLADRGQSAQARVDNGLVIAVHAVRGPATSTP